jgi:hypothetical protein
METMSKFKVGDRVLVTSRNKTASKLIQIGDIRIVTDTCVDMVRLDDILNGWLFHSNIELVPEDIKPKWTIYNNEKAWQDLSDKQKGKLLLAAHSKIQFFDCGYESPIFNLDNQVYKAQEAELVKPEPTMAELFVNDWMECSTGVPQTFADKIIAKGWNKPCK